jgi:endonuclease/exonuclease/phosphatase family metal-dependent hydrolase
MKIYFCPVILLFLISGIALPQVPVYETYAKPVTPEKTTCRLMFYNMENFFDTWDDSLTADEEFTPGGAMHWTVGRYNTKQNHLFKTIVAVGEWQPPDIIGVCEIENRKVLLDLVNETPLSKYAYKLVHSDSPDRRGIDVAMLYNSHTVEFISSKFFRLQKPGLFTRDILYCRVNLHGNPVHLFVNHWPSRSAGQIETEKDRLAAATLLRHLTDSLFMRNKEACIIIMGDFNDEPADESISGILGATTMLSGARPAKLYNLSKAPREGKFKGSLKYQGIWNLFDQIIVSGSLLSDTSGIHTDATGFKIFGDSFLLRMDDKYNGYKPFRTYNGYRYEGGFSDHLPVFLDVKLE